MSILHTSPAGHGAAASAAPRHVEQPDALRIDWRAARRADRACCCTARPAVIAVIPPTADRTHPTDLLLCGHHYRVCRDRLTSAGAVVTDLRGIPVADGPWPAFLSVA